MTTYTSKSQVARIATEAWVEANGYCLACDQEHLMRTVANTKARDFCCDRCGHGYELKASLKPFGRYVVDGAYASMIEQITNGRVSNFLLMQYSIPMTVTSLVVVHNSLITPEVIVRRKPLSETARRAGWTGCKLCLADIPREGRIPIVQQGIKVPPQKVRDAFSKAERLAQYPLTARSWSGSVLNCLHRLQSEKFTLQMAYSFENELATIYPANHNVKARIRQQLQVLRDAGFLEFVGRATYRFL